MLLCDYIIVFAWHKNETEINSINSIYIQFMLVCIQNYVYVSLAQPYSQTCLTMLLYTSNASEWTIFNFDFGRMLTRERH